MKRTAEGDAVRNRDLLIARLGDGLERCARDIAAAVRRPPDEVGTELRRLARRLKEDAREVRWIGTGRLDAPHRRRMDLVTVVRNAARKWQEALERRGSTLLIEANPLTVVGLWDRTHLGVIVGEMVSNACKHGGARSVRIHIEATAREVVLRFRDAGEAPLPRRPFARFVRGPTATGEGMGVGLWLTDALAKQDGGGLRFRRSRSGGTEAIVRLAQRA